MLVDLYLWQREQAGKPVLLTGLILALGLCSREAFDNYGRKPDFVDSVKRAKLLVEGAYEEQLFTAPRAAGPIFALKNMGWKDRHEVGLDAIGNLGQLLRDKLGATVGGE